MSFKDELAKVPVGYAMAGATIGVIVGPFIGILVAWGVIHLAKALGVP